MARSFIAFLGVLILVTGGCAARVDTPSFEKDWRFLQSDAKDGQQTSLDDASWKSVDLPHDWAIAGPFDQHAATTGAGGFLPSGVGWYRKHFTLPAEDAKANASSSISTA